jgi:Stage II sporulation protein E (SpoIIE)
VVQTEPGVRNRHSIARTTEVVKTPSLYLAQIGRAVAWSGSCLTAAGRTYNAFQMRIRRPVPSLTLVLLLFGSHLCFAYAQTSPAPAVVTIEGLGKGTVELSGPWRFHIGDNPRWADPSIDDTPGQGGWETILPDRPWGAQSHFAYAGFAWYRLYLRITPAPDVKTGFQLLLPSLQDICEVYWNGRLVGRYGKLPPHPSSPVLNAPAAFTLPDFRSGTLAIRVWDGPLGSSSSGDGGGFAQTPLVGDSKSIAAYIGTWNYNFLRGTLYINSRNILYFFVALAAFVLWLRRRNETLLLWFSIFAVCPAIWTSVYTMRLPVSSQFTQFIVQPLWALRNVALWFLLIEMLHLRSHRGLVRWARIFAAVSLTGAFLDGCLTYVPANWISPHTSAWIDGVITIIIEPCQLYLLVLVANGFRQKLDSVRWVLALTASLSQLLAVIVATVQQGQRFTHWTLAQRLSSPLFHVGPVSFNADTLLDLLVFLSIIYTIYHYIRDQQDRKAILEQELHSARELQQVLIPEKLPTLPGFSLSSSYLPALEVGGDFFQIIPLDGPAAGSTLIVLGDVSGKGLRAAMAVSLIVGAVRTLAETTSSPAEILAGLSRRLHGRLQGGFSTCVVLRLDPHGVCTLASAGHPAPYFNDKEIDLPGALPLGIDPAIAYEEATVHFHPGDRCALYTDGLLEARTSSGEIFSFERLQALFASGADAAQASEAAVAFGQDDDITVVTLTRLANA